RPAELVHLLVGLFVLAERAELAREVPARHVARVGRDARGGRHGAEDVGAALVLVELVPEEGEPPHEELDARPLLALVLAGALLDADLERLLELLHGRGEAALRLELEPLLLEARRVREPVLRGALDGLARLIGRRRRQLGRALLVDDREHLRALDRLLAGRALDDERLAVVGDDLACDALAVP